MLGVINVQFQKASKEEKELSGLRMNEEITAEVVRVVIGKGICIY